MSGIKHVFAKNKLVVNTLRSVKENVISNTTPTNNPISLNGLDKPNRYQFFFRIFPKEFNSVYKGQYRYLSCDEIDMAKVRDKKFVIIENVELLNGNIELQERLLKVMDYCLNKQIQVILCSNKGVNNLDVIESLKSILISSLILYIED